MPSKLTKQSRRILEYFKCVPNIEINAPILHIIGSDKLNGYLSSFSKKISEARAQARLEGGDLLLTKDEYVKDGDNLQRQTGYTFFPKI